MARIVFDLDGTLIDSAPDICGIANALLTEEGVEPISLAETRSFIGNGVPVLIARIRAVRGLPDEAHERLVAAFLDRYAGAVDDTRSYPGVLAALSDLHAAGHALGICSNKPVQPCHAVLEHLGLARFFDAVVGGDSLPTRKPDPAMLHLAFERMGGGPTAYVGDSETDAETARRAAVPFLLFTEGYRKSDVNELPHAAAFSDFAALPALLAEVLEGQAVRAGTSRAG